MNTIATPSTAGLSKYPRLASWVENPADRHCREAVGERVEPVHPRRPVAECAQDGQPEVDVPEGFGGLRDPGGELLILHRPGSLRPVELEAPDPEHRQDRDREHDDSHSAQPLEHLAVEEQGPGKGIDPGDDRRAGGGEPGHRLEHRVGERHRGLVEQQERHRTGQAEHPPERDHDEEAVPEPELPAVPSHRHPQENPAPENHRKGDRERCRVAVGVEPRGRERRHHGQAEQPEQKPEDALDREPMHGGMTGGSGPRRGRPGGPGGPGRDRFAPAGDRFAGGTASPCPAGLRRDLEQLLDLRNPHLVQQEQDDVIAPPR